MLKRIVQIFLPILVILGAIAIAVLLFMTRRVPEREPEKESVVLVNVESVSSSRERVFIEAGGTVLPAQSVELKPQVGGVVIFRAENLEPGGFFKAGEEMLRIDPRDYEFALARQRAELARSSFELTQEKGQRAVAQREWELLGQELETSPEGRDLALRIPHLQRAEASLDAARNSVAQAELNLERCVIRAPFNAMIRMENVDPGQLVNTQTTIASLTGTDLYHVQAAIPVERLASIRLPNVSGEGGAPVHIIHTSGETSVTRDGRIIRLLPDLEQSGRMARILIAVDDPLGLKGGADLPLLLNAYVKVKIEGVPLENVMVLSPSSLREGNRVWVMTDEGRLDIREVNPVWREEERVLVDQGLRPGERVVTSRIGTPIPGMKLALTDAPEPVKSAAATGGAE